MFNTLLSTKKVECIIKPTNQPNGNSNNNGVSNVPITTGSRSYKEKCSPINQSKSLAMSVQITEQQKQSNTHNYESSDSNTGSSSLCCSSNDEITVPRYKQVKRRRIYDCRIKMATRSKQQFPLLCSLESNKDHNDVQQWVQRKVQLYKKQKDQSKQTIHCPTNKIIQSTPTRNILRSIQCKHTNDSSTNESDDDDDDDDDEISNYSDDNMTENKDSYFIKSDCRVTDLLSHFRTVDRSILTNRLTDFDINMTGLEIIEKVASISVKKSVDLWNITYLPGNRTPCPPHPPSLSRQLNDDCQYNHISDLSNFNKDPLLPQTPIVSLSTNKECHSVELRQFCLSQPVVLIRNLTSALPLDLSLFTTKALVESFPNHRIEQRIQDLQAPDENKDPTGKTILRCFSSKSVTTIQEYANYQARTFVEARKAENSRINGTLSDDIKEENITLKATSIDDKKRKRKIFFGTNCDLSNEVKWSAQLDELNKLPSFLKVVTPHNILSHCDFTIMGMNSVQLYMKVPGCRTPGHQENNNFCSININIGPGDCEWFSVPEQYWGAISSLCEEHEIDYLSGSWWPNLEDLKQRQIPVYRFIQRPGDLAWINSGTVHWVQSIGWCNNVAWNVGPFVSRQYNLAMERYEYNKLRKYKSIVPMVHLSWQLAKHIKVTDSHLYQLIKYTLMVSLIYCSVTWKFLERAQVPLVYQPREDNEPTQYCEDCEHEVFNIFLIRPVKSSITAKKSSRDTKYETRCLHCAKKLSTNLDSFKSLYQYELSELINVYDDFKLQSVN